jgi:cytochrome P450
MSGAESVAQVMVRLGTRSVKRAYAEIARRGGIVRRRGMVSVFRNDDVIAASHDERLRGPGAFGPSFAAKRPLIPMDLDGPDHARYLRFLGPLFAPRAVARGEESTRALANELIDGFAGDGRVELMGRYCRPVGALGFLDLFGLPRADLPFLLDFVSAVVRPPGSGPTATVESAVDAAYDYLRAQIEARQGAADPPPGMLTDLVTARADGPPLSLEEVQDIAYLLLIAGIEMVPTALACIVAWLAGHPDAAARLVAEPELVPAAVEELLRHETPTPGAVRLAQEDVRLPSGDVIAAGDRVRLMWATANLDDRAFEDPLRVDFTRAQRANVAFGNGHHRCIGAPLSRMQLRVALTELHRRIPCYRIDPAEPPLYFDFGVRQQLPLEFDAQR